MQTNHPGCPTQRRARQSTDPLARPQVVRRIEHAAQGVQRLPDAGMARLGVLSQI